MSPRASERALVLPTAAAASAGEDKSPRWTRPGWGKSRLDSDAGAPSLAAGEGGRATEESAAEERPAEEGAAADDGAAVGAEGGTANEAGGAGTDGGAANEEGAAVGAEGGAAGTLERRPGSTAPIGFESANAS